MVETRTSSVVPSSTFLSQSESPDESSYQKPDVTIDSPEYSGNPTPSPDSRHIIVMSNSSKAFFTVHIDIVQEEQRKTIMDFNREYFKNE